MLSRLGSKKSTRGSAAPSTAPVDPPNAAQPAQPEASTSAAPIRTRSGRLLTPIAESVKSVKSRLAGSRRASKAPTAASSNAEASNAEPAAQVATTSSSAVVNDPTPSTRKAAPKKANRRTLNKSKGKGKATMENVPSAPVAGPSSAQAPVPHANPAPDTSVAGPTSVAAATVAGSDIDVDDTLLPTIPEHRRLKRQGAVFLDKDYRPLPEGTYPGGEEEGATSSILDQVAREVSLEQLMTRRLTKPATSIYGLAAFAPSFKAPFETFDVQPRMPSLRQIVFPSVPEQLPPPAPVAQLASVPVEPIIFPAVPEPQAVEDEAEPARPGWTRLTRQYAAIFGEDGHPIPLGRDGAGELEPIGEIVANILKAGHSGPYPPTWRGSLFESDDAPLAANAPRRASTSGSNLPGTPSSGPATPRRVRSMPVVPPSRRLISRQGAVYLDQNGRALPPGVTMSAEEQFRGPAWEAPRRAVESPAGRPLPALSVVRVNRPAVALPAVPPSRRVRISRQGAVYLDKDGSALPPGVTATAAEQFPDPDDDAASVVSNATTHGSVASDAAQPRCVTPPIAPALAPAPAPLAVPPSRRIISRQGAVYLDKDGFALPPGVTATAAEQFPADRDDDASSSVVSDAATHGSVAATETAVTRGARAFSLFARRSTTQLAAFRTPSAERAANKALAQAAPAPEGPQPAAEQENGEEEEEATAAAAKPVDKGKKRAREDDEEDTAAAGEQRDARPVRRIRLASVRSYTQTCSLLRVKVSMIPLPAADLQRAACAGKAKLVVFPAGKGPLATRAARKRPHEEVEADDASQKDDAEEPAAKKARIEA
ncbi:hypothetical protein C8Q78DRAFT_1148602 [Trametes maxima]|nr:hypothetical protein C8Q78DRAFT_1148602 [Trametes maxima]